MGLIIFQKTEVDKEQNKHQEKIPQVHFLCCIFNSGSFCSSTLAVLLCDVQVSLKKLEYFFILV